MFTSNQPTVGCREIDRESEEGLRPTVPAGDSEPTEEGPPNSMGIPIGTLTRHRIGSLTRHRIGSLTRHRMTGEELYEILRSVDPSCPGLKISPREVAKVLVSRVQRNVAQLIRRHIARICAHHAPFPEADPSEVGEDSQPATPVSSTLCRLSPQGLICGNSQVLRVEECFVEEIADFMSWCKIRFDQGVLPEDKVIPFILDVTITAEEATLVNSEEAARNGIGREERANRVVEWLKAQDNHDSDGHNVLCSANRFVTDKSPTKKDLRMALRKHDLVANRHV
ncbi:methylated-DNA--protein-cysteine methyltransferase [Perkinsus olseni]|uniref:Methylated-DNA--protein-cysteine methyltransferase n=1 Tax=Perkinsus olseni TaxID=32597 RepID=A0A7J6S1A8_PEROL|nr:methylated-DNA--protein-cysteine methyltransferase [Perkinsus olseni]